MRVARRVRASDGKPWVFPGGAFVKEIVLIDKATGDVVSLTEGLKLDTNQYIDLRKVHGGIKSAAVAAPILYLPAAQIGKRVPILSTQGAKFVGNIMQKYRNPAVAVVIGAAGASLVLSRTDLMNAVTTKTDVVSVQKTEADSKLLIEKSIRVTTAPVMHKYAVYFAVIAASGLLGFFLLRKFIRK